MTVGELYDAVDRLRVELVALAQRAQQADELTGRPQFPPIVRGLVRAANELSRASVEFDGLPVSMRLPEQAALFEEVKP